MRWMKLLLVCALVSSVGVAVAEEDTAVQRARIHVRAGIADYDEGRYTEAAGEMEQAYALKPLPDLQYNLAQCYERLGRLADAEKAYTIYLGGMRDAQDRAQVELRIAHLRERQQAEAEGKKELAPRVEEKVVFKTLVVYREAPPPPGRAARWAAYALGALGVAGLATGVAFAVLTSQAGKSVHDQGNATSPPVFDGALRAKQDAAHLYPIGTGVGFAVGGLALGGAAGLYVGSRKIDREAKKQREAEQALLPTVAPFYARAGAATIAGLSVAGQF